MPPEENFLTIDDVIIRIVCRRIAVTGSVQAAAKSLGYSHDKSLYRVLKRYGMSSKEILRQREKYLAPSP